MNDKFIHALFFEIDFINYLILDFKCSRAIKKIGGKGELTCIFDPEYDKNREGWKWVTDRYIGRGYFCIDKNEFCVECKISESKENEDI